MLKTTIKALSLWLYELSNVMANYDEPENWWGDEEWTEYNQDWDDRFYLSEVISREVMTLAA
jgi:hypothetical protein